MLLPILLVLMRNAGHAIGVAFVLMGSVICLRTLISEVRGGVKPDAVTAWVLRACLWIAVGCFLLML